MPVEVSNLSKSYGKGFALKEVSFTLDDGKTLILAGPSGSGKTTLLNILAGIVIPDGGSYRRVPDLSMVFQEDGLFDHLTAMDNILYGIPAGTANREAMAREAAELCACMPCLDQLAGTLSGGQRQRVALARALANHPSLLLLDEPFAHMDKPLAAELMEQLRVLQKELGFTMVMASHDPAMALRDGDWLLCLENGKAVQFADAETACAEPATPFLATLLQ